MSGSGKLLWTVEALLSGPTSRQQTLLSATALCRLRILSKSVVYQVWLQRSRSIAVYWDFTRQCLGNSKGLHRTNQQRLTELL